jgi:bacterioferritin
MQGDPKILEALNLSLTAELTAINQYFIHAKLCAHWGYRRLAKVKHDESIGEMRDADQVIERILFLGGLPNMQRLNPVRVGEDPIEQHELDLALEQEHCKHLNETIALCRRQGDNGTSELLEAILKGEEQAIDWLETQLALVSKIGKERYLAEQIRE